MVVVLICHPTSRNLFCIEVFGSVLVPFMLKVVSEHLSCPMTKANTQTRSHLFREAPHRRQAPPNFSEAVLAQNEGRVDEGASQAEGGQVSPSRRT